MTEIKTCGSCSSATGHEENGDIQRHWCNQKSCWMLSDCKRCQDAPDDNAQPDTPHCSLCPHDKPGCLVCSAGVLRHHADDGMHSPKICSSWNKTFYQGVKV